MNPTLTRLKVVLRSAVAVLACAAGAAASAQTPPSWRGGWYHTEVIVFQRPAVSAATSAERLLTQAPRMWPAALLSLAAPGSDTAVYYEDAAGPGSCRALPAAPAGTAGAVPQAFGSTAQPYGPTAEHSAAAETIATVGSEPEAAEPSPERQLHALLERYEAQLQSDSLQWLPAETLTLGSEAARLRSGGYVVLWHRRWVQDVPVRGAPQSIQIWTDAAGGQAPQLSGTLQVTRGRFMHVDANLWYEDGNETGAREYMLLRESRRMRLGELHYLDHPKLGVLVRTTRVGLPDSILEAFAALQLAPDLEAPEFDDDLNDPSEADLLDL